MITLQDTIVCETKSIQVGSMMMMSTDIWTPSTKIAIFVDQFED
jgi:hypothetical protein